MTNLTNITEKEIIYAANHELMRRLNDEEARLHARPDSQITKTRVDKLNAQLKDICDRILEIENAE